MKLKTSFVMFFFLILFSSPYFSFSSKKIKVYKTDSDIVLDGVLKYSGGANFENPTDANSDNVYDLIIFADDGFNRTTQNVQLTIEII